MPKPNHFNPRNVAAVPIASNAIGYKAYVRAGQWKCAASPTGAHHRLVDQAGNQTCEHCGHTIKRNAVGGIW